MFKNFTNSVTGWLGAVKPDEDPPKVEASATGTDEKSQDEKLSQEKDNANEPSPTNKEGDTCEEQVEAGEEDDKSSDVQQQIDEMAAKTINTAKEWGTWLYGVGKNATAEVVKQAKTIKDTVEEKTILGEFQKEQEKYITENKEKKSKSEAAVPPWVGYNEEESMKKQILALSQDKRNFLRNPPAGVQFHFEYESMFPIAMATLQEDLELEKMRFELVPKQVKEDVFWRNYFYRVSLIKQSAQLTSLAQQTGSTNETTEKKTQETKAEEKSEEGVASQAKSEQEPEPEDLPSNSPPDNEFISDTFQTEFNEEDLKKEMQMLGMSKKEGEAKGKIKKDIPEWEKELQAELQEYEVVNDDDNDLDAADLEQELLQQIEAESKQ